MVKTHKKNKKFTLNSQLQTYQILTKDDQMFSMCPSYFIITVTDNQSVFFDKKQEQQIIRDREFAKPCAEQLTGAKSISIRELEEYIQD